MQRNIVKKIALVLALMTVFQLCGCKAKDEDNDNGPKIIIDDPQSTDKKAPAEDTDEKVELMLPICDALMRVMEVSEMDYTSDNSSFVWMTLFIAVNQGIALRDEYEIINEDFDVSVPGWSVAELMYSAFGERTELIEFPAVNKYIEYDPETECFIFAGADYSQLSNRVESYRRGSDGLLRVSVALIDDESKVFKTYVFIMDDNNHYAEGGNSYPYRIMSARKRDN